MSMYLLSVCLTNFVASYVLTTHMCSELFVRIIYYFPCSYNVGSYYVSVMFELAHALFLLLCELAKYILYHSAVNCIMYVLAMLSQYSWTDPQMSVLCVFFPRLCYSLITVFILSSFL
jgi:hypothetical protein